MDQDGNQGAAGEDVAVLLGRCAQGDHPAFRALYDTQSPRLYALALRLLQQPGLAADALHDAFLQVWQRSERFDPARGHAEAWLTSLVRYRAIDILRRRGRETVAAQTVDVPADGPDSLAVLALRTDTHTLEHCLQQLDETGRKVVRLAYLDGLTHAELALRLDAPLGTVKSWIRRSLISLKRCFDA